MGAKIINLTKEEFWKAGKKASKEFENLPKWKKESLRTWWNQLEKENEYYRRQNEEEGIYRNGWKPEKRKEIDMNTNFSAQDARNLSGIKIQSEALLNAILESVKNESLNWGNEHTRWYLSNKLFDAASKNLTTLGFVICNKLTDLGYKVKLVNEDPKIYWIIDWSEDLLDK